MRASWILPAVCLLPMVAPAAPQTASAAPDWFLPSGPGVPRVTQGNEVKPLVDGDETFESMTEAIGTLRPRLTRIDGFDGQVHNGDVSGPIAESPLDHCIYGTAPEDGKHPYGSIYKVDPRGAKPTLTTLYSFHLIDGKLPIGAAPHGVVVAKDGTVYGVCSDGGKYGAGTLWRLSPGATEPSVVYAFHGGTHDPPTARPTPKQILDDAAGGPQGPPVIDAKGTLYGITPYANGAQAGVIYTCGGGECHGLYMFNAKDAPTVGYLPTSLALGRDGALYGTTVKGGAAWGAVFKMATTGGTPTPLHKFDYTNGSGADSIMQDSDGNLFGTCGTGGPGATPGTGLVYEITPAGQYTVVHIFDGATGFRPVGGVVEGKDHYLYGVTAVGGPIGGALGRGVIYRLDKASHDVQVMHAFGPEDSEGRNPGATPLAHSSGMLYGTTTNYGGPNGEPGGGAFWRLDPGRPDYLYVLGWLFDSGTPMQAAGAPIIRQLLAKASNHDVQVRAMLWKQLDGSDGPAVAGFNSLYRGAAIHDSRTLNFGSHHQKILIVNGSEGLTAFCGGLDIVKDRILRAGAGYPVHDVHCRVRGPAAQDLLNIFLDRWSDHPDHVDLDKAKGPLVATRSDSQPVAGGTCMVQVGRTYGNGSAHKGVDSRFNAHGYAFAPNGEHTAASMILHAISRARKFIYVEDQYFVDTDDPTNPNTINVRAALMARLTDPGFQQLIVVIPDDRITGMTMSAFGVPLAPNEVSYRRRRLIEALRKAGALPGGGNKVHVFCPKDIATAPHTYVHAKTWVFDDEYAIIGSVNICRRSFTHDSEAVVGVYDTAGQSGGYIPVPKRLRMRLWAEHLGINEAQGAWTPGEGYESAVSNPLAPGLWNPLPPTARVAPYDDTRDVSPLPTSPTEWLKWNTEWDDGVDPDGL